MKKNGVVLGLIFGVSLGLVSTAAAFGKSPQKNTKMEVMDTVIIQNGVPGGLFVENLEITATVLDIDYENQTVKLLKPDGFTSQINVGPEAINFNKIKKRDLVKVVIAQGLLVYLESEQSAASADATGSAVALSAAGQKPAGVMLNVTRATGTIIAMDMKAHTAVLQFDNGTTRTFPVRKDIDLNQRKLGEPVVFESARMVAISIEKK